MPFDRAESSALSHGQYFPLDLKIYIGKEATSVSLFVIADLHLSSDKTKSMEIFGPRWSDYMNKLCKNWNAVVSPNDTVIIPGDISWGLKLEDAKEDLLFFRGNKVQVVLFAQFRHWPRLPVESGKDVCLFAKVCQLQE